jgi:hypothetical protein
MFEERIRELEQIVEYYENIIYSKSSDLVMIEIAQRRVSFIKDTLRINQKIYSYYFC